MTIPKGKLICNKVSKTTIPKLQQESVPIVKRDIQNFRGAIVKNHLTKCKNYTSDKIIDLSKSNSKFVFTLPHDEEFVVRKQ